MHVSWLGSTAVRLQTKPLADDVTIILDPYKQEKGSFPRSLTPHITLFTNSEKDSITLSGDPFILSSPGEIETKGVLITAVQGHSADQTMFRIDVEDITIAHLGKTNKQLTEAQQEVLSGADVLFLPVGGGDYYDSDQAVKVVNDIEPRIIIPIGFKSDNEPDIEKVDMFLKNIGTANQEPEKKVIIKKKDLPQDETQVIVLTKE